MYAIKIAKANDPNIPSCPAPLLSTFQVAMGWSNTSSALDIQWDLTTFYDQIWKKITRRKSKWHGKSLRVSEIVCFVQICCEQIYSSPLSLSLDHLRRCNLEPVPPWKLWASSLVTQLYPNIKYWHDHHAPHLEWLIPWSPGCFVAHCSDLIPGFGFYLWGKSVVFGSSGDWKLSFDH